MVKSLALLHESGQIALLELAWHVLVDIYDLLLLLIQVLNSFLLTLAEILILLQLSLDFLKLLVKHLLRRLCFLEFVPQSRDLLGALPRAVAGGLELYQFVIERLLGLQGLLVFVVELEVGSLKFLNAFLEAIDVL